MSRPTFLQLPLHVVGLILAQLDDMQTLGSAIFSHPLLYASYKDLGANSVTKSILRKQIPADVMRYAVMAYDAQRVDQRDEKAVQSLVAWAGSSRRPNREARFQEWYFQWRLDPERDAAPAIAAALSKTHSVIHYFSDRFIKDVLPLAPEFIGASPARSSPAAASSVEIYRVHKAFYRFQAYCNLRDLDPDTVGDSAFNHIQAVLSAFSPWVNEQLACIHDYLERVLSQSFDQVAAHDVEWGTFSVDWISRGKHNRHKQAYLTYGLHFLYKLDQARDYQRQQQLLKSKGLPATSSGLAYHFEAIRSAVCSCCPPGNYRLQARDQWTDSAFESYLAGGTSDGIDGLSSDPFSIWWYAHKHNFAEHFEFQRENSRLRSYGYVMWVMPAAGSFSKSVVKRCIREAQRQVDADEEEVERAREAMQWSWRERATIFQAGGRGYWSEGDLSQIVWTGDNAGPDQRELPGVAGLDASEPRKPGDRDSPPSFQLPIRSSTNGD